MALAAAARHSRLSLSTAPVAELAAAALAAREAAEVAGPADYLIIAVAAGSADQALLRLEDVDVGQPKSHPDRGLA